MQSKELLKLVQNVQAFNDLKSFEILRDKYNNLIVSQTKMVLTRYRALPVGSEDIENVLTFYFYELIKNYDPESGVYFNVYVKQRLRWKSINYAREMISGRYRGMNQSIEFSDDLHEQEKDDGSADIISDIRHNYKSYGFLSDVEKMVLAFMLEGFCMAEISKKTNKSEGYLYKVKKNISKKLKIELGL